MLFLVLLMPIVVVGIGYYLWPEGQLAEGAVADYILVDKSQRKMTLYYKKNQLACYTIALGASEPFFNHPEGPKRMEGDYKTPEGLFRIVQKEMHSEYHRSLRISYPGDDPVAMKNTNPGGGILIHGVKNKFEWIGKFHRWIDWTKGCIAVTNAEMEEIYNAVPQNCKIEILP
jgi:murein L,D-transpeptidase YafK